MSRPAADLLRPLPVFQALGEDALAEIGGHCLIRTYRAGELILGHTDQSFDVLFMVSGQARVSIYSADGQRVGFRDIVAGDIFGELSAIDGMPRSASVECLDDCTAVALARQHFLGALARHPAFNTAVLQHLTRLVRSLTTRVFEFSTLAVRNRVRLELLRLADEAPSGAASGLLAQVPTHAEMASRISTHREAVSREFAWLERNNYIAKDGRNLRITDVTRLRALVDEDWS